MAIIENKSTESGDIIIIKTAIPIVGLISLTDFISDTDGEDGDSYFYKEFRYTIDGVNYSNWIELTELNLEAVAVEPSNTFLIEYKYSRLGADNSSELQFNSVEVNGTRQEVVCGSVFQSSIFADYFSCTDTEVLSWCINVTEKLYKKGIVPNYIVRGENASSIEDKDYIDFWRSVACFFAYFVIFARKFKTFSENETLLADYLKQRNLFVCNDTELEDLNYLMKNYYDEIRQRGTFNIVKPKSETKEVDGELLRLICYDVEDEFLFNHISPELLGWNIGSSSPMYMGLTSHIQVNKAYENSADFENLSKYPLLNAADCSITTDDTKEVLRILNVDINEKSGIGAIDLEKAIKVNPGLDYEITFLIKQPILEENISFECFGFNSSDVQVSLKKITDNSSSNIFFSQIQLNKNDIYYLVRGIIYNKDHSIVVGEDAVPNIGYGNHLKFANTVVKIIPRVFLDNTGGSDGLNEVRIYDFKIKPLSLPHSLGFIQTKNFISVHLKNNNGSVDSQTLENYMRRYLLPYNSTFKNIYL